MAWVFRVLHSQYKYFFLFLSWIQKELQIYHKGIMIINCARHKNKSICFFLFYNNFHTFIIQNKKLTYERKFVLVKKNEVLHFQCKKFIKIFFKVFIFNLIQCLFVTFPPIKKRRNYCTYRFIYLFHGTVSSHLP